MLGWQWVRAVCLFRVVNIRLFVWTRVLALLFRSFRLILVCIGEPSSIKLCIDLGSMPTCAFIRGNRVSLWPICLMKVAAPSLGPRATASSLCRVPLSAPSLNRVFLVAAKIQLALGRVKTTLLTCRTICRPVLMAAFVGNLVKICVRLAPT